MVNNACTRSVFNGKYGNGPLMTKIKNEDDYNWMVQVGDHKDNIISVPMLHKDDTLIIRSDRLGYVYLNSVYDGAKVVINEMRKLITSPRRITDEVYMYSTNEKIYEYLNNFFIVDGTTSDGYFIFKEKKGY